MVATQSVVLLSSLFNKGYGKASIYMVLACFIFKAKPPKHPKAMSENLVKFSGIPKITKQS